MCPLSSPNGMMFSESPTRPCVFGHPMQPRDGTTRLLLGQELDKWQRLRGPARGKEAVQGELAAEDRDPSDQEDAIRTEQAVGNLGPPLASRGPNDKSCAQFTSLRRPQIPEKRTAQSSS